MTSTSRAIAERAAELELRGFVAPAPAQSEEATEEMVTVAAAVTATAAAPSKPIVVPEGYAAGAIVIDKKELSTKLGIALSNAEDKEHPVVCTIGDDGAAATPSCQLQGKLEAGDRVLSIEADRRGTRAGRS